MKSYSPLVPVDVPPEMREVFLKNYNAMTRGTPRLLLFTGDHKIEHMNDDFRGADIPEEAHGVEHLFKIAAHGSVGAFAAHPGLIARYGHTYSHVPYLAKMNAKTNVVPTAAHDPYSALLASITDVLALQKQSQLKIHGVGYTIYLGSVYEEKMLEDVGKCVFEAHRNGLVVVLWMYPRGHHVALPHDPALLAGAAGVGASLGADFVKLNPSHTFRELSPADMREIMTAAGNTKIIFAGGEMVPIPQFLEKVNFYLQHGASGIAAGRNIYQHELVVACSITDALATLIYHDNLT